MRPCYPPERRSNEDDRDLRSTDVLFHRRLWAEHRPVLPRFVADLHWLANQGVAVIRYNLAQEPQAFAANVAVKAALTSDGNACLPLILVNGTSRVKAFTPTVSNLPS